MTQRPVYTVDEWINQTFNPRSRPKRSTVWRWIREGRIPARKLGRRYYIEQGTEPL